MLKRLVSAAAPAIILSLVGASGAMASPALESHGVIAQNIPLEVAIDKPQDIIYLGGDSSDTAQRQLQFIPNRGTIGEDNTYQMIPGDSLSSVTQLVNTGPTEAVLQVYVTDVEYTTPTTATQDDWFHQVEFHSNGEVSSLYDVITTVDNNPNGALILETLVDQDAAYNLGIDIVFPEDATAGHDDAERSFAFHVTMMMTDSRSVYPDDDTTSFPHPSGKEGKKHPPGQKGKPHPGVKGKENAPGQQKRSNTNVSHNHPGAQQRPLINSGYEQEEQNLWPLLGLGGALLLTSGIIWSVARRKSP